MNSVIETYTGLYFDYADPKEAQVCIDDVARALSQIPRFGGHTSDFYSVAEHALYVAEIVGRLGHNRLTLAALHHDSHEAYLGDVPTPLKRELGEVYASLRAKADWAIAEKLTLAPESFHQPVIVEADALALRVEAAHLKKSLGVGEHWGHDGVPPEALTRRADCWSPMFAEDRFLERHDELMLRLHGRTWR